ncbi:MAG TPA: DMT family transporter [Alphaproteobacteria bacterium]|nr:DMT family transporter [Alphaproteobacteria bacterium]
MPKGDAAGAARERLAGIVLIALSAIAFGAVDGLSKMVVASASPAQIVWARYALAIPFLLLATPPRTWLALARSPVPRLQLARGVVPLFVSFGMVLGVQHLPLADTTVILYLAPLLVVALSAPLLKERVHRSNWLAVVAGFLAVLLVARPGFSALSQYAVYPLVAAVFYALQQILTRRLMDEPPRRTLAWTLACGAVITTPFAIVSWHELAPDTMLLLLALGAVFGIAQLTHIAGLARAPAALVAPLAYVQIIAAVGFGYVLFGELPDALSIVGIAMIIGAGLYVVQQRRRAG